MTTRSATHRSRPLRVFDRIFRNPRTGKVVIAQWPNLPLGVFLAATTVRVLLDPSGRARVVVVVFATIALVWWSGDEIRRGDSLFRRVLGGVVLLALVVGQLMR